MLFEASILIMNNEIEMMKRVVMIIYSKIILFLVLFCNCGMFWNSNVLPENSENSVKEFSFSLAPMIERVMPSVISINVEGTTVVRISRLPNQFKPFFGKNSPFCQNNSPFRNSPFCKTHPKSNIHKKFHALGSGVIVNAEKGYAVTNNHVVEHASKIQVQLSDGRRYDAKVIGKDARSDIALIQLNNANNLIAIKIANSDALRVGDYAVAIGNPYGLGETVTSGIISALGRSGLNIEHYENFIQTDAAINKGNSGGALINLHGELIGINTAILAPDGGNIGIGFAIPGNTVKNLIQQMVKFGQVKRGELGIIGLELNSDLARIMKIRAQKGAFVSQVLPNSSAFSAGIRPGDIIISLNDKPIYSFSTLRAEIGSLPVQTKMELGILRSGEVKKIFLELRECKKNNTNLIDRYLKMFGLHLSNASIDGKKGIKVDSVKPNTMGSKIGFKKNDIILAINQKSVMNIKDLKNIFDEKPEILVFSVKRGSNDIYLVTQHFF